MADTKASDFVSKTAAQTAANDLFPFIDVSASGTAKNSVITRSEIPEALSLVIGTNVQAYNSTLSAVAAGTYTGSSSITTLGTISSIVVTGGSITGLTTFALRDTSAAYDLTFVATSSTALSSGRNLTFDVVNASRSIKLAGNIDLAANFTTSGANALTLTTTGSTNVTLPTSGTLAILGANTFTDAQIITKNSLGVTSTAGLTLQNTTAATLNNQQISPSIILRGNGWKTSSSASDSSELVLEAIPIQHTTYTNIKFCVSHRYAAGVNTAKLMEITSNNASLNGNYAKLKIFSGLISPYDGHNYSFNIAPDTVTVENRFNDTCYWSWSSSYLTLGPSQALAWASSTGDSIRSTQDTFLQRDGAANTLALRNSTSSQSFRVYNTYTSSTNKEFLEINFSSNIAQVLTVAGSVGGTTRALKVGAGTSVGTNIAGANTTIVGGGSTGSGTGGSIVFQTTGAGSSGTTANTLTSRWEIPYTGNLIPAASSTYDIGDTSHLVNSIYATDIKNNSTSLIVPIGGLLDFYGMSLPTGFLLANGDSILLSSYSTLSSVLSVSKSGSSVGTVITVSDTSDLQVGWTITGTEVGNGVTISSIDNSTTITISSAVAVDGAGTYYFWPYGAVDSNNFNLPSITNSSKLGYKIIRYI